MIIPIESLPEATLTALLEEYATRGGTDYGEAEITLEAKVLQLRRQLEKQQLALWFDDKTQTVNLLTADQALSASNEVL